MGLDQEPFEMQFESTNEARAWLAFLISQKPSDPIDEEAQVNSAKASGEANSAPAFSYSRESLAVRVHEVKQVLHDLLMRSSGAVDPSYCNSKASELAEQWLSGVSRESKGEGDELLGTLWLEGGPTETKHGAQILSDLEWQFEQLSAQGVTDQDIQLWWDLPVWQRQLNMVENAALFDSRFRVRYKALVQQSSEEPQWLIEVTARRQAACTVPRFAFSLSTAGELPWELYNRANDFLLRELRENPKFELEAIEAGSFNALFRAKELEI
jgi:hypothetical protein